MHGDERREKIVNILKTEKSPVSGTQLAKDLKVSRQVIVQDIALLRASEFDIVSTNRGYVLLDSGENEKQTEVFEETVIKVKHTDAEMEDELNTIVDCGVIVKDVFVHHKLYGKISVPLEIKSRRDVKKFLEQIQNGQSSPLKNITAGYHYHTLIAEQAEQIADVKKELLEKGYLIIPEQ